MLLIYIGLGGVAGTLARYLLQGAVQPHGGGFPLGTLAVNIAGSFVLGFLMRFGTGGTVLPPDVRGGLTIGFCGAFTTMSTFGYETIALLQDGDYWRGGVYVTATLLGSLGAVVAGMVAANRLL